MAAELLTTQIDRLLSRGHRGMELGLDRTLRGLAALDHPERGLSVIHIAGTNGKGSTAALVESIAREAGLRTGLYTSPHLEHFRERIQICGEPIAEAEFARVLHEVFERAPEDLTFFETLTLASFLAFRDAGLDVVVLEVGLGGRLDATNVIEAPLATAVTTITEGLAGRFLEHQDFLGTSIAEIASEKAGIAKQNVPLVLGRLGSEASVAIGAVRERVGAAPCWQIDSPAAVGQPMHVDAEEVCLPSGERFPLASALAGPHQQDNAAVAIALVRLGLPDVSRAAILAGLAKVRWPGRLERLSHRGVSVWLDGAHNLEGARALRDSLSALNLQGATLLFGALADKPYEAVLDLLAPNFSSRVYTQPGGRAPAPPAELAARHAGEVVTDPTKALDRALDTCGNGGRLVVTGSLYLVGFVRQLICGGPRDPALGL